LVELLVVVQVVAGSSPVAHPSMADDAIKAEIVFDNNEAMEVQSTVQEVRTEIEGQKRMALPLIKVLDQDGAEVWLNATHIRMIKAAAGVD
jgi:hypothetical protein